MAVLAAGAGSGLWISLTLAVELRALRLRPQGRAGRRARGPVDRDGDAGADRAGLADLAGAGRDRAASADSASTIDLLLVLGGAVTAIPLLLFTAAARRLPYSTLGFLQYIAPSLQFLLAVLAFGEPLTTPHIVCFGAIWTALAIFTLDGWRGVAKARAAA